MTTKPLDQQFEDANKYSPQVIEKVIQIISTEFSKEHVSKGLNGCGIIYIWFGYKALRANSKLAKALEAHSLMVCRVPYHTGVMLRVGYDNAHGDIAAKAEATVEALKAWNSGMQVLFTTIKTDQCDGRRPLENALMGLSSMR